MGEQADLDWFFDPLLDVPIGREKYPMTTKIVQLEGKAYWAKVFPDNREMKGYEGVYESCNGAYEITVALDDGEFAKLQDSGSKIQGSLDDDGFHRCTFKRKHEVYNSKTGDLIPEFCGAPKVVDADGVEWPHTEDDPHFIGNESDVLVVISVTPDKKKKTISYTRLEQIQVKELVEYNEGGSQLNLPF